MRGLLKSTLVGVASGVATYLLSVRALGYTNAFVMPSWAPLAAWDWIVVLGLGAALVALIIHVVALLSSRARASAALVSFFGTTMVALTLAGVLSHGAKTLAAWLLGAFLASLITRKLRPNKSFKPMPLRGTA